MPGLVDLGLGLATEASEAAAEAGLAALLEAPLVDPPDQGAMALANTSWSGTQECALTGSINMVVSGPGTFPQTDRIDFDDHGYPSGMRGMQYYQFKRANFTESSFDLACVGTMTTSTPGESVARAVVIILTGQRSADGRELTGRRVVGQYYLSAETGADFVVNQECSFKLRLEQ